MASENKLPNWEERPSILRNIFTLIEYTLLSSFHEKLEGEHLLAIQSAGSEKKTVLLELYKNAWCFSFFTVRSM